MKRSYYIFLIIATLFVVNSGCVTHVSMTKIDPTDPKSALQRGIHIEMPAPFVLVTTGTGPDHKISAQIVMLPDPDQEYAIDAWAILAKQNVTISRSVEMYINEVDLSQDTSTLASALVGSAGTAASAAIQAQAQSKAASESAASNSTTTTTTTTPNTTGSGGGGGGGGHAGGGGGGGGHAAGGGGGPAAAAAAAGGGGGGGGPAAAAGGGGGGQGQGQTTTTTTQTVAGQNSTNQPVTLDFDVSRKPILFAIDEDQNHLSLRRVSFHTFNKIVHVDNISSQ